MPTERQSSILVWLGKVYPHSGRMFQSALQIAANADMPCRGRMIAHAYREICSEIMNPYSPQSRVESKPLLDELSDKFEALNVTSAERVPAALAPIENDPRQIAVPHSFIRATERLVSWHRKEPTARERARAIFEGIQRDV